MHGWQTGQNIPEGALVLDAEAGEVSTSRFLPTRSMSLRILLSTKTWRVALADSTLRHRMSEAGLAFCKEHGGATARLMTLIGALAEHPSEITVK
jgi:hypothetical protein